MYPQNFDKQGVYRKNLVGFNVSDSERDLLNKRVKLSGLPKREYCYRRCMKEDIVVEANPKVYKALRDELRSVHEELTRITAGTKINKSTLSLIKFIAVILDGVKGEDDKCE